MAFSFDKLTPEAKRAAFAHMSKRGKVKNAAKAAVKKATPAKKGSSGNNKKTSSAARFRAMSTKPMPTEAQDKAKSHEHLSPGYLHGHRTANDVEVLLARYRRMHGRNPPPKEEARLRRRIGKTRKN